MFTRLNNKELLEGTRYHIENTLVPELKHSDYAVVLAQIVGDLMGVVQRRLENGPQWLMEECDIMLSLLGRAREELGSMDIAEAKEAVDEIDRALSLPVPEGYESFSLAYLEDRYSTISFAVSRTIRALGFAPDEAAVQPLVEEFQRYMLLRSDHEMVIAGNDPARGRG
ncbi:MAG: hypothetical protein WEB00_14675 [Dehalococcoidia bacterium]